MNILFIAKPLSKRGNGVVSALKNQVLYLQEIANVALFNIGVPLDSDIAKTVFLADDYTSIGELPKPYNNPDIVVFEEIYKLDYVKHYKECLKKHIPYVVVPHGSLVAVEQNKKKFKHIAANILLFNRFIRKATAVQYLNEQEKGNSRFKCKRTIIIPNSIEFKERVYQTDEEIFRFVYVGRYDVTVKGLDLLIDTFIELKQWCSKNKVILDLYGPIEDNEPLKQLQEKIKDCGCTDIIKINDGVYGEEKDRILQESSAFIQTSRNEGQPMSIIEALSFGLPCVVTYATSFGEYCNKNQCGIGVDFSKQELKNAIKKIFNDKEYYLLCKINAIENMKNDFDIKSVANETLNVYEELIATFKE